MSTGSLNRILFLTCCLVGWCACRQPADPSSRPDSTAVGPVFTDVTAAAGLGEFRHEWSAFGKMWMPETFSSGGGFFDYDGDGWVDMLLIAGGIWPGHGRPIPGLRLYRNNHDGTFSEVTGPAGLESTSTYGFGLAAADYDNDGDQDLFVTTLYENLLFRNEKGVFSEIGRQAGIANESTWSTAALFFDADRDGWVDLYVGNYVPWTPETDIFCTSDGKTKDYCTPHQYRGIPGRFYHNNKNGTFSDWTQKAGLGGSPGKTLGITELDYNRDGWPDFAVANDTQPNLLYRNDGDGTFTEVGLESGIAFDSNGRTRAGMGMDAGIVDSSGETSIVIGNFSEEIVNIYRHTGSGLFVDRSPAAGVGALSYLMLTFGISLTDVDLDADLDLILANGHIVENVERIQDAIKYRQPAQLFLNDGSGNFTLLKDDSGGVFHKYLVARSLSTADYDRDGDIDLMITENGGPVHLWRNENDPGKNGTTHYLRVRLRGTTSNADALGARVVIEAAGKRQERRLRTGGSYLSQSEKAAHFGLGVATRVDSLIIFWPSGRTDRLGDLEVDREIFLTEGRPGIE